MRWEEKQAILCDEALRVAAKTLMLVDEMIILQICLGFTAQGACSQMPFYFLFLQLFEVGKTVLIIFISK